MRESLLHHCFPRLALFAELLFDICSLMCRERKLIAEGKLVSLKSIWVTFHYLMLGKMFIHYRVYLIFNFQIPMVFAL